MLFDKLMGACSSVKETTIKDKGLDKDFEYFRQLQNKENIYELKAKIWEITREDGKLKYKLICKYFFMKPNGEFESRIKTASSGQETIIKGVLEKFKKVKFLWKESLPEKEDFNKKNFEGDIKISEKGINCPLKVEFLDREKRDSITDAMYYLEFSKSLWKVENTFGQSTKSFNAFLKFDEEAKAFNGISHDENGFSLWAGVAKELPNANLVQCYLGESQENQTDNLNSYVGLIDRVAGTFLIDGTVTNSKQNAGKFSIKRVTLKNKI